MSKSNLYFNTILCLSMLYACKKETITPVPVVEKTGAVLLKFDNRVGNEELILNGIFYKNSLDESYNVQTLSYQIADVTLVNTDNKSIRITADTSILAIDENDILNTWRKIENVPLGAYKSLSFTLKKTKNKNTILEQSGSIGTTPFNKMPYKLENTAENIPILLPFPDGNLTVRAGQTRPSSVHIFGDIKPFAKSNSSNITLEVLQKMFEVNHLENY